MKTGSSGLALSRSCASVSALASSRGDPFGYPTMMRRSRQRLGLRECRAASLLGITVREYRRLGAAGQDDVISADV